MSGLALDFPRKVFNVNVLGLLLTTQAAIKHLSKGASIINIGSVASRITPPNSAVYTGTRGAVDAITGVLARELGPKKIRVNTIAPGVVEAEGTQQRRRQCYCVSVYRKAINVSVAVRARTSISRAVGASRTRINSRIRRSPQSTAI